MAFFSGLLNGYRRTFESPGLPLTQRPLADAYEAAVATAARFRQLQAEHQRLQQHARQNSTRSQRSPSGRISGEAQLGAQTRIRSEGNLARAADAVGGTAPDPDGNGRVPINDPGLQEKLRRGGGLNGVGYMPTAADRHLLARIIYAESHEIPQDFEAIGWATINRVGRQGFQRTLSDVLHARNQFAIVREGNPQGVDHPLWTDTERPEALTGTKRRLWLRALGVADGIMTGRIPDPTGGATQFFADTDYDPRNPRTAPGGFPRDIQAKEVFPSRYASRSRRQNRQYFWLENDKPSPISR
jgi:hypothetical protein